MWGQWEGLSTPQQVPTQAARAVSKSWAKEVKVCVPVWVCAHVWVSPRGGVHTCGAQSGYVLVCVHSVGVCTCVCTCVCTWIVVVWGGRQRDSNREKEERISLTTVLTYSVLPRVLGGQHITETKSGAVRLPPSPFMNAPKIQIKCTMSSMSLGGDDARAEGMTGTCWGEGGGIKHIEGAASQHSCPPLGSGFQVFAHSVTPSCLRRLWLRPHAESRGHHSPFIRKIITHVLAKLQASGPETAPQLKHEL